ncbi:hypothetical protein ADL03_12960 [Nocardia sp. NRRL S-836]|nr:hypothetical protein ADL03_12960 [Nocardia sp. NRRL S-836]
MLRANRVLGHDDEFRSARNFARAFRTDGDRALAPSQITRWEKAESAADGSVLSRYEVLLRLPGQSLTASYEAARRFLNEERPADGLAAVPDAELHELIDRACTPGAMCGADWRVFTRAVAGRPDLLLHPPGTWRVIAENLLGELVVAERTAWLVRQEAMSRLLEHRASARHAFEACVGMADDRANPVCIEPISLLDASTLPEASGYVLAQLRNPDSVRALHGALLAAVAKVRRGHFTAAATAELKHLAAALPLGVDDHPLVGPMAAELAHVLRLPGTSAPAAQSQVCVRLALTAQARLPSAGPGVDEVLVELVSEAMFSRNPDERLYAAALITATPYGHPLAVAVTEWLAAGDLRDELLLERGLGLLNKLGAPTHRVLVRSLLLDPALSARNRHAAAWAATHSPGRIGADEWRAVVGTQTALVRTRPSPLDDDILRGLVHSIGTDAHPELLRELHADSRLPAQVRDLAAWWLRREPRQV